MQGLLKLMDSTLNKVRQYDEIETNLKIYFPRLQFVCLSKKFPNSR